MAHKLTLYEDQEQTLDALREGFRAGHQAQLLYAPTGAGKTEMAMALMLATAAKEKRSAMILDRIVLCNQTSDRLHKYNIDHGVLMSGHWRYRPYEKIQVCSAQTLEKRESFPGLNLLIVDECHAQRRETIAFIKKHPEVRAIGLSASPFTKGLGATYTNVVSATTTEKLVGIGRLVPLKVFIAKQIDMKGAKKVGGEFAVDDAGTKGMKITGDVVREWVKMTTLHFGGPRKTIVFCANVAHGADLQAKFAEAGFNFVAISYKDTDEFKKEAIADFGRPGTKIDGLIACDILTKGFDVPDVMIGVSVRPFSKSFSSHVQQMGRVMRSCQGKEFALWLDHSGNYLRFRQKWEDLYHDGVDKLADDSEQSATELKDKEVEAQRCPKCSALWPRNSDTCPQCGHTKVRLNLLEHVEGELVELGGISAAAKALQQAWYSQLIAFGHERGYSKGWAFHKFEEKFKAKPRGLHESPATPSPEVQRWIKSRLIAFAKAGRR